MVLSFIRKTHTHTQLINLNTIQCYHTKRNNQQSKWKLFPHTEYHGNSKGKVFNFCDTKSTAKVSHFLTKTKKKKNTGKSCFMTFAFIFISYVNTH